MFRSNVFVHLLLRSNVHLLRAKWPAICAPARQPAEMFVQQNILHETIYTTHRPKSDQVVLMLLVCHLLLWHAVAIQWINQACCSIRAG